MRYNESVLEFLDAFTTEHVTGALGGGAGVGGTVVLVSRFLFSKLEKRNDEMFSYMRKTICELKDDIRRKDNQLVELYKEKKREG